MWWEKEPDWNSGQGSTDSCSLFLPLSLSLLLLVALSISCFQPINLLLHNSERWITACFSFGGKLVSYPPPGTKSLFLVTDRLSRVREKGRKKKGPVKQVRTRTGQKWDQMSKFVCNFYFAPTTARTVQVTNDRGRAGQARRERNGVYHQIYKTITTRQRK